MQGNNRMRKWNGWGDDTITYHLSEIAKDKLQQRLGSPNPLPQAELSTVLATVPPSRLPLFPLVDTNPEVRVRHACGQSVPDLLALREGNLSYIPDGVAFPTSNDDVRQLLEWALQSDFIIIPYGGGTSVVGHITPDKQPQKPVLVISMEKMYGLLSIDPTSLLARFETGIRGRELEKILQIKGYTLGHYPQSFDYSTLGGWIATRSSGQQSLGYGRIEQLFAGGRIETLEGTWQLPAFPASSAGPDLREWVLGSEGKLGIITEAVMRISRVPEKEYFIAYMMPDWNHGIQALRELTQANIQLSMLRLSNAEETHIHFMLNPKKSLVWLMRYLKLRGMKNTQCLLLAGFSGYSYQIVNAKMQCDSVIRHNKGLNLGKALGKAWQKKRFMQPYLRESLLNLGYVADTLETAANWDQIPSLVHSVEEALKSANSSNIVFTHLSHCYSQGASAYTTYLFPVAATYAETLEKWRAMKIAASNQIIKHGGTISHQHGVGRDHKPWLENEKGKIGMQIMRAAFNAVDTHQQLNQGVLINDDKY